MVTGEGGAGRGVTGGTFDGSDGGAPMVAAMLAGGVGRWCWPVVFLMVADGAGRGVTGGTFDGSDGCAPCGRRQGMAGGVPMVAIKLYAHLVAPLRGVLVFHSF